MLRIKTFHHIMSPTALASERFRAGNDPQESGFAFSIGSDQGDLVSPVDLRRSVLKDRNGSIGFAYLF